MLAVCFTLAFFAFWLVLGRSVLAMLPARRGPLQELLLAPVVGVAVTVLGLFALNRLGLPVRRIAWPLAAALALAAGFALWRRRPAVPVRLYLPFAGAFLLGLWLTGRPMLEFGSDWVSVCNNDMANYCLGGQHFLDHGYYEFPDRDELLQGRDYTLCYYFFHVIDLERPGPQLLLAWAAGLSGRDCLQLFMPAILALHLVLLSAAAALVCGRSERAWPALLTCLLLALSALNTLGTVTQLIAQILGLALLAGSCAVLFRPYADMGLPEAARHGVLAGLLVSALPVAYPEVFPFLGVGLAAHVALGWWRRTVTLRPLLLGAAIAGAMALVYLNAYGYGALQFLFHQATRNRAPELARALKEIFPQYLLPSGPATLWGLFSINPSSFLYGSAVSAKIVLGAGLLLAAAAAALWLARRGEPVALVAAVMLAVAAVLYRGGDAFGLFKLAMFVQPFLLGTVVLTACALLRRPALHLPPLLLLAALGVATQGSYVEMSRGSVLGYVEIANPSASRVNREFRQAVAAAPVRHLLLDSCNSSLLKFQSVYARGTPTAIPAWNPFTTSLGVFEGRDLRFLSPATLAAARALRDLWMASATGSQFHFDLHDPRAPGAVDDFARNKVGSAPPGPGTYLAASTGNQSVLNRRRYPPGPGPNFVLLPWEQVHDHLLMTVSELGQHYYCNFTGKPSALYALEADPMLPGQAMCGCGGHLLLEVLRPSPRFRLLLDFHTTLQGDGDNRLPPAAAVGARREPFGVLGRGSARVVSPPLEPQWIDGSAYVALDMQAAPKTMPDHRSGLMTLFGTDVTLDRRRMTAFVRNVSVVSEEEYARLRPPGRLEHFPADLLHPDLEYSGIYEDGWLSESSFFRLAAPDGPAEVVVRGMVPLLDDAAFTNELRVLVDGREVARRQLGLGTFEVTAALPPGPAVRRVELRFGSFQRLPGGDGRPCAALLQSVGLRASASAPLVAAGR